MSAMESVCGFLKDGRQQVQASSFGERSFAPAESRFHPTPAPAGAFIGEAPAVRRLFDLIQKVAPLDVTVLLIGETGTGKGLIARAIHELSQRRANRFLPLRCRGDTRIGLRADLWGQGDAGSTLTVSGRREFLQDPIGGTLFLDEIHAAPAETQMEILALLEDGWLSSIGSARPMPLALRVVAAASVDLGAEVRAGRFREDLYYRLNVFPLRLPPLRERRSDIPLLVAWFRARFAEANEVDPPEIPQHVLGRLMEYDWPGNVRELENYLEQAMVRSAGTPTLGARGSTGWEAPSH